MKAPDGVCGDIRAILAERGIAEHGTARLPDALVALPGMEYALSFMVPLPRAVVTSIQGGPNELYFHHYRTINAYLDQTALRIVLEIQGSGYDAHYVPASQSLSDAGLYGLLPHKAVARLAGLGQIGRNALFLSERYGPAVRLSTVVTDMPLPEPKGEARNLCAGCDACVRACPSGALCGVDYREGIARDEMIDARKCGAFMCEAYRHVGRGAVCGRCFAVCPAAKQL